MIYKIIENYYYLLQVTSRNVRFVDKQTNPSISMITMTFQSCPKDEIILVIVKKKSLQLFNPILQRENINSKCRNKKNKNKR